MSKTEEYDMYINQVMYTQYILRYKIIFYILLNLCL